MNYILQYYQGIKDGSIVVGEWIRLVYEYIVHGLEHKDFFYDAKKAKKAIEFIGVVAKGLHIMCLWHRG